MSKSDESRLLRGYTNLVRLDFSVDQFTYVCVLTIDLTKDDPDSPGYVRAYFTGVSNLSIKNIGGALTQLQMLTINNISDRQLDRVNYEVSELEHDSLSFVCQSFRIEDVKE
jgi:hypothetical protein